MPRYCEKVMDKRRRRREAITKCYAFEANAKIKMKNKAKQNQPVHKIKDEKKQNQTVNNSTLLT